MTGNSFGSAMGGLDGWPAYGFGTLDSLCGNVDVELPVGGTFCRVLQWRVLAGVSRGTDQNRFVDVDFGNIVEDSLRDLPAGLVLYFDFHAVASLSKPAAGLHLILAVDN